jgi:O-antigen ligase
LSWDRLEGDPSVLNTQQWLDWFRRGPGLLVDLGLVSVFFGVPTSRVLINVGLALLLVGLVLGGGYRTLFERVRSYALLWPTLLVLGLVLAGSAWSVGSPAVVSLHLSLYGKLPYFLLVLVALDSHRRVTYSWGAFSAGCLLMVSLLYYRYMALRLGWEAPPSAGHSAYSVLRNYAVQSLLTVFCCLALAITLQRAHAFGARVVAVLGLVACLASLVFLLESKTGLVGLLLVLVLVAFNHGKRAGLLACIAAMALLALAFKFSPVLTGKLGSLAADLSALVSGGPVERTSSGGYRLAMWSTALQLMARSWWFGHGTGSYAALSPQFFNAAECAVACVHPHNQWLFFGVEYGLLGVAVISFLVYRMAALGLSAPAHLRQLVWGLTLLFVVDAMFNAPLWLPGERVFFFSMFALLAAQIRLASPPARNPLP